MDSKGMGAFISDLRKSKNMTQRTLAEKLNVTDKAVSKWERGAGYPEITILPRLAEALGVSAEELLLGRRDPGNRENPETPAAPIVRDAAEYVAQSRSLNRKNVRALSFYAFSAALLLAAGICMLCNFVSRRTLDWSFYVLGSAAAAWLTVTPLLRMEKHGWAVSLAALTLSSYPLLLLIRALCPSPGLIIPFVLPIVAISLGALWVLALLFFCAKIRGGYFIALILLLGGVLNPVLNWFIKGYFHQTDGVGNLVNVLTMVLCLIAAAVVTVGTHFLRRTR